MANVHSERRTTAVVLVLDSGVQYSADVSTIGSRFESFCTLPPSQEIGVCPYRMREIPKSRP